MQVVADHHERVLVADLRDERVEDVHRVRVEARVRLVEEDHLGLVQQRAGDREPLEHAARERAHQVEPAVVELDGREQLVDAVLRVVDAVQVGEELEVLLGGEVGVEQRVVADEADALAQLDRVLDHVEADDLRRALRGAGERREHLEQRRLAGAVRAEDRQEGLGKILQKVPRIPPRFYSPGRIQQ